VSAHIELQIEIRKSENCLFLIKPVLLIALLKLIMMKNSVVILI